MVWSHVLSNINPNTVIPALLFAKYVTAKKIERTQLVVTEINIAKLPQYWAYCTKLETLIFILHSYH